MELDELKKSWNALDRQLQKEPIADERQIAELIARCKANTRKGIGKLIGVQRFSIGVGVVFISLLLTIWLLPLFFQDSTYWQQQFNILILILFFGASILAGLFWDYKCYRWLKNTRIEEMPIVTISQRMTRFRQWAKYEVIAISIWTVLFNALYYWVMGFHKSSWQLQVIVISLFAVLDATTIYLLYKKLIYKHLNNIKQNIEELKDVCTE